jgi:FMN-dependent NADH-azoreductase
MNKILYLKTSPRGEASHSTRVGDHTIDELRRAHPGASVVERDLGREQPFHIDAHYLGALATPEGERDEAARARVAHADALIDELLAADTVVISVAMINFAIPSTLKSWIDQVARAGRTFRYDEHGKPRGLATGKRVILVQAHGGQYCGTEAQKIDFVTPYLKHMLGFMGMNDIETIHVEGTIFGPEVAERSVAAGILRASAHVSALRQAA